MGHVRAQTIKNTPGADLVAVCDLNPERLAKAAAEFGCFTHTDYAEMLKRSDVEVVVVMTPSGLTKANPSQSRNRIPPMQLKILSPPYARGVRPWWMDRKANGLPISWPPSTNPRAMARR